MPLKEKYTDDDGWTRHDGQRTKTDLNSSLLASAQMSK